VIERALSVLAAREQRWELYERLAVRRCSGYGSSGSSATRMA